MYSDAASREIMIMAVDDWRLYWKEATRHADGHLEAGFARVLYPVYDAFGETATVTAIDLPQLNGDRI
eukprot:SAG31_NODE_47283_length_251_cov_0.657895_1_plen_67_part_01